MRRGEQRVVALGDRRRAGVVGEAGDDRVVLVDRDDPFDDADRNAGALERTALLDMQLDITMMRALRPLRVGNAIGIAADSTDRVGPAHAVPDFVKVAAGKIAGDDSAAGETAAEREAFL